MLDEVVDRKEWITREHFMHLVGFTNLLPGPNSSEVAIHIGYTQRGWRGAFATGLAFLLPTLVMVTLSSALYFRYGSIPAVEGLFWGLKPAILAVILAAGWKLGKTALGLPKNPNLYLLLLGIGGTLTAFFLDRLEIPAMVLGGFLSWVIFRKPSTEGPKASPPTPTGTSGSHSKLAALGLPLAASPISALAWAPATLGPLGHLFLLMTGAGAVLFGGGYMLVAILEPFVVGSYGWLSPDQFLDGIALTQAVPGPIVTLVAFIGYSVAGVPGALVATGGIYLPTFAAVLVVAPHLEKWRHAAGFRAALRGVNAVVAGAILGVGLSLLESGLPDRWAGGLFFVCLFSLVRLRIPAVWVVLGGFAAGFIHLALAG